MFKAVVAAMRKSTTRVQFGSAYNQVNHTFRHVIEEAGLRPVEVAAAIRPTALRLGSSLAVEEGASGMVTLQGVRLQFYVYKLDEGLLNIGRIVVLK